MVIYSVKNVKAMFQICGELLQDLEKPTNERDKTKEVVEKISWFIPETLLPQITFENKMIREINLRAIDILLAREKAKAPFSFEIELSWITEKIRSELVDVGWHIGPAEKRGKGERTVKISTEHPKR